MIRKLFISFLWILCSVSGAARGKDVNILFLGNSFTQRHNIPDQVEAILEEGDPETNVNTSRVIYGGQNMFKHYTYYHSQSFIEQATISDDVIRERINRMKNYLKSETAPNPEEWKAHWDSLGTKQRFADIHRHIERAIRNHEALLKNNPRVKWNYVVLQSWRDISNDPEQAYAKYATLLAEVAKKNGAEVILYMTSPETQNKEPVEAPVSPESADRDLKTGLELVKRISPKAVVHVPLAIKNIQTGGTDLVFRYINDGHPNQTCAFLTTNLFYAAITGKSPVGLSFDTIVENKVKKGKNPDGGPLKIVFTGDKKTYLEKMAFDSTMEFNRLAGK